MFIFDCIVYTCYAPKRDDYSFFIIKWLFYPFSSLDHNSIKTSRVILISNFNEIELVAFIGILLHLDEIEWVQIFLISYRFLSKKNNLSRKSLSFFFFFWNESVFMLFRTVQFFSLWDHFPTRGNEKNYRMDCYLCLDRG